MHHLRNLIYQERYSEAFRTIYFKTTYQRLGTSYINTHYTPIKAHTPTWLDFGYSEGIRRVNSYYLYETPDTVFTYAYDKEITYAEGGDGWLGRRTWGSGGYVHNGSIVALGAGDGGYADGNGIGYGRVYSKQGAGYGHLPKWKRNKQSYISLHTEIK